MLLDPVPPTDSLWPLLFATQWPATLLINRHRGSNLNSQSSAPVQQWPSWALHWDPCPVVLKWIQEQPACIHWILQPYCQNQKLWHRAINTYHYNHFPHLYHQAAYLSCQVPPTDACSTAPNAGCHHRLAQRKFPNQKHIHGNIARCQHKGSSHATVDHPPFSQGVYEKVTHCWRPSQCLPQASR